MTRRFVLLFATMALLVVSAAPALALFDKYQYMTPEQVKEKLDKKEPMHLVDIQVQEEFDQHSLPDAIATYSYPVKSEEEKARIDAIIDKLQADQNPVVVVCPRGGGGAERCYNHLKEKGIAEERLFILEKGQQGWPYPEYVKTK